jgi:DNA-nicking Smr family endonuclease
MISDRGAEAEGNRGGSRNGEDPEKEPVEEQEPIQMPITGELDLHTFRPDEVKDLLPDYFGACREKGILVVRVVHGKGTGNLRRTVHALLSRLPEVSSFAPAGEQMGGWGATMVTLRPLEWRGNKAEKD